MTPASTDGSSGTGSPGSPGGPPPASSGLPSSYVTSYASPLRSSRVAAARRLYTGLQRIPFTDSSGAEIPANASGAGTYWPVPRFLYVSPDGAHLAIDRGGSYEVRDTTGKYLRGTEKVARFDLTVTDEAYYIYANEALWSGAPTATQKPNSGYSPEGWTLALRQDGGRRVIATQNSPVVPHGGPGWNVDVYADRFAKPDHSYAELVFSGFFPGHGVAAIGPDWRIVLAMDDGTLRVFSDTSDPELRPIEIVHTRLPYVAVTLSLAPPLILTTSSDPAGARVHALDSAGVEKWSVAVPFAIRQPPVDGGGGRVVALGDGIASIDNGRIDWVQPSPVPILGTAFDDGTMALSVGAELRVVDRAGSIRQALRVAPGETVSTPPCITTDGSVWIATQRAFYVAR
jgi:hypothetical protein